MSKSEARYRFEISGESFVVPESAFESERFEVASVPRKYGVRWAPGDPLAEVQALVDANPRNAVLIDQKVYDLHLRGLRVDPDRIFFATATEEFKSLKNGVVAIIDWMARLGLTKSDTLIVVGGGITQDVGGFASCLFKRGIPWVFFPTTLLSMCDSCIGGKAGVNHGEFKNQLALFSAPREVVINPGFLKTLSPEDIRSGMGEVLKLHVTGGRDFLERYRSLMHGSVRGLPQQSAVRDLLWGALLVKKAVIERDEFELNLRRSLNYGHTVGHVVESLSNFAISHGKAVTIGMWVANQIAADRGVLSPEENRRLQGVFREVLDPAAVLLLSAMKPEQLGKSLATDKKNTGSKLNFAIVSELGRMSFLPVENDPTLWDRLCAVFAEIARECSA
ncbi:MAG: 3-dehydroquinate synthase [Oligoflexia bacterium]|nr:3-dehydroquinate synthase [Oligoflexia bacterium]